MWALVYGPSGLGAARRRSYDMFLGRLGLVNLKSYYGNCNHG